MNFTMIPWGNAYYNTTECPTESFDKENGMKCWTKACGGANPPADCFTGKIFTQHGTGEESADTMESCAIAHYPDIEAQWQFVYCFEGQHGAQMSAAQFCAKSAGMDYAALHTCATGAEGASLDAAAARRTAQYGLTRLGTPWIVINGKCPSDTATTAPALTTARLLSCRQVPVQHGRHAQDRVRSHPCAQAGRLQLSAAPQRFLRAKWLAGGWRQRAVSAEGAARGNRINFNNRPGRGPPPGR